MNDFLTFYKRMGFNVIPITAPIGSGTSDGKKPAISTWIAYQTRKATDEEIENWFKNKDLNIGIITGQISNLNVLDIDDEDSYRRLVSQAPFLTDTLTVKTGKGYHIYYRPDIHTRTTIFSMNNHIHHIKADGGYVVAPPSRHVSGRKYEFHIETAPSSYKVDDIVKAILKSGATFRAADRHVSTTRPIGWAGELCQVNHEGSRNTRAAQLCGLLVRFFKQDPDFIMGLMKAWNEMYCSPPLSNYELEGLVQGEYKRYSSR